MQEIATAFTGQTTQNFADYAETVRGHVRYELVRRNLGPFVTKETLQIADIGGGGGIDALWLAGQGHSVTIAEPAAAQLALAEAKLAAATSTIRERVTLRRATTDELLQDGEGKYDLVLSHGVAMYLPDPDAYIDSLVMLTRPHGHISVLEKGYWGAYTTLVREGKYSEADQLAESRHFLNHMQKSVWAFMPSELVDTLRVAGASHAQWSGVRVLHDTDYRPISEVKLEERQHILSTEAEAGRRIDTRGLGQMIHVIAQKD
jgi:SAM-dependent methyltransferase